MAMPACQVTTVSEVDLENTDCLSHERRRDPICERWTHAYISFFLMILRIWVVWANTIPATIAAPTCSASIISSLDIPNDKHWFVYASIQYGHFCVVATTSAMSAFSRSVS